MANETIDVVANTLGWEITTYREFKNEYLYQPTKTKKMIFNDGGAYYCVSKTKPTDEVGQEWTPARDQFWAEKAGTILWISEVAKNV